VNIEVGTTNFLKGDVINISPTNIKWAMTQALTLDATLGSSTQSGLVYSSKNLPFPLDSVTRKNLLSWYESDSKQGFLDERKVPLGFCDSKNEDYMVVFGPGAKNGHGYMLSPVTPTDASLGLNIVCARGAGTVGGTAVRESTPAKKETTVSAALKPVTIVPNNETYFLYSWIMKATSSPDKPVCTFLTENGFRTEWDVSKLAAQVKT
jgi:hypothetical protein